MQHTSNFVTTPTNGSVAKYLAQNDNDLYLYHGIGFISSGAKAEFKLRGPQPLLFTAENLKLFSTELANYYQSEKNKILLSSLGGNANA